MGTTRGWIRGGLLLTVATSASAAIPAAVIPSVSPEDVGMSSERLLEIDAVMRKHIDAGTIQGAVTVVARRGRVVHFEAHGLMDVERVRATKRRKPHPRVRNVVDVGARLRPRQRARAALPASAVERALATLPRPGYSRPPLHHPAPAPRPRAVPRPHERGGRMPPTALSGRAAPSLRTRGGGWGEGAEGAASL